MESNIEALCWWPLTKRILFTPRALFGQLPESISYRTSGFYLAKTALVVSLINALVLAAIIYVVAGWFVTILSAFFAIFATLLTPLIAIAAGIPPERVPDAISSVVKGGGAQVGIMSAKLGGVLFVSFFATVVASTCFQAGVAYGIARLLGGRGSLRATVAVYAFSSAAWIIGLIPAFNVFVPIYGAVLCFFGMRKAHGVTTAKALLSVALAASAPVATFVAYNSISNCK